MKRIITILLLGFSALSFADIDHIAKTSGEVKILSLSGTEYEPCTEMDESEASAEYCSVYINVKEAGGAFDVWQHMPKFPDYKDTIRPYKIEYLKKAFGDSVFINSIQDILYRDLEKIWHCLAKDDIECLASMTYIVDYKQFYGSRPQLSLDKIEKGKWRIKAENEDDPAFFCKDKGEYFKGILHKVEPYVAFSDPLEFYRCLFNWKPKNSSVSTTISSDEPWLGGVSMAAYGGVKNLLRTTFVSLERNWHGINIVDRNKTLKENYPKPFFINLAKGPDDNQSIILLYGTPANPNGFAIAGFGKAAWDCDGFCYPYFKDGP